MDFIPILRMMRKRKLLTALLVLQIALTYAVFSNTLVAYVQFRHYTTVDKGFDETDLIYALPQSVVEDFDREAALHRDIEGVRRVPGVAAIAPMANLPSSGTRKTVYAGAEKGARDLRVSLYDSDAAASEVFGLTYVEGRAIRSDEVVYRTPANPEVDAGVIAISQSLARELFRDEPAVGKTIWMDKGGTPVQIVGVYKDILGIEVENDRLRTQSAIRPQVNLVGPANLNYLIRVEHGAAARVVPLLTDRFGEVKGRYMGRIATLDDMVKRDLFTSIAVTRVFGIISLIMLIVVSLGIAGLASYSTGKRKREFGTRRALGSTKLGIVRLVLLEGAMTTAAGIAAGVALAFAVNFVAVKGGLLSSRLGPGYLIACALFLLVLTALAVYWPAQRAASIDPALSTRG